MLHSCSTIKTATVRALRNELLKWIGAGGEVAITTPSEIADGREEQSRHLGFG